jgi:hypothetical protein
MSERSSRCGRHLRISFARTNPRLPIAEAIGRSTLTVSATRMFSHSNMSRVVSYTEFHAFFSLVFSPILIKHSLRLTAVPFSNNDPVSSDDGVERRRIERESAAPLISKVNVPVASPPSF